MTTKSYQASLLEALEKIETMQAEFMKEQDRIIDHLDIINKSLTRIVLEESKEHTMRIRFRVYCLLMFTALVGFHLI